MDMDEYLAPEDITIVPTSVSYPAPEQVIVGLKVTMHRQPSRDQRTELHHAKSKKLIESLRPSSLEEIGSTTFVKKINALSVIQNERTVGELKEDTELLDHFVQHNKLTVLIQDMVTVALWRDRILPKLMELSREEVSNMVPKPGKLIPMICKCTVTAVLKQAVYSALFIIAATDRPEVCLGLGSDILDLIDYCVGELRYFINNKPDHDPTVESPANVEREKSRRTLSYRGSYDNTWACISIIMNLLQEEARTPEVLNKLLHPETRFVITMADMILAKPWSYANGKFGKLVTYHPQCNPNPGGNPTGTIRLESMEAMAWGTLHRIYVFEPEKFCSALQMTRECHDKLLLLRDPSKKRRLVKEMPTVIREFTKFLKKLASEPHRPPDSWYLVPLSPYFVSIGAHLEKNEDAIVRIHTAMSSFGAENMDHMRQRFIRDNLCLDPIFDMNNCCFNCAETDAGLRCSRCRYAYYCDRKCQRKDWAKHKLICSRE